MSSVTPANKYVVDTVALVLRLERRKMGVAAQAAFQACEAGATTLYIPSMVFAEILYLSEKLRITANLNDVDGYLKLYSTCVEHPLTLAVAQAAASITDIPELHDRLIAASARSLGVPLLTTDPVIQASKFVQATW